VWTHNKSKHSLHTQNTPTVNIHINTHGQPVEKERNWGWRMAGESVICQYAISLSLPHTLHWGLMPDSHCAGPLNHSPSSGCAKHTLTHTHTHTHTQSDCWQQWVVRQQMVSLNEPLMRDNWSGNAQTITQPNTNHSQTKEQPKMNSQTK